MTFLRKNIGLVEVNEALDNFSRANIIRGRSSIKSGDIIREQMHSPYLHFLFTYSAFPVRTWSYESLSENTTKPINSGWLIRLALGKIPINGWGGDFGLGYLSLGNVKHCLQIDGNLMRNREIIAELLEGYFGLGGSLIFTDYAFKETSEGTEGMGGGVRPFVGLKLNLSPGFSIFGDVGYGFYGLSDWELIEDLSDYDDIEMSGFTVRLGLSF